MLLEKRPEIALGRSVSPRPGPPERNIWTDPARSRNIPSHGGYTPAPTLPYVLAPVPAPVDEVSHACSVKAEGIHPLRDDRRDSSSSHGLTPK